MVQQYHVPIHCDPNCFTHDRYDSCGSEQHLRAESRTIKRQQRHSYCYQHEDSSAYIPPSISVILQLRILLPKYLLSIRFPSLYQDLRMMKCTAGTLHERPRLHAYHLPGFWILESLHVQHQLGPITTITTLPGLRVGTGCKQIPIILYTFITKPVVHGQASDTSTHIYSSKVSGVGCSIYMSRQCRVASQIVPDPRQLRERRSQVVKRKFSILQETNRLYMKVT